MDCERVEQPMHLEEQHAPFPFHQLLEEVNGALEIFLIAIDILEVLAINSLGGFLPD